MYKTQSKHKAMHGGYKNKPTRQSVNALLDMYAACFEEKKQPSKVGIQLKLEL